MKLLLVCLTIFVLECFDFWLNTPEPNSRQRWHEQLSLQRIFHRTVLFSTYHTLNSLNNYIPFIKDWQIITINTCNRNGTDQGKFQCLAMHIAGDITDCTAGFLLIDLTQNSLPLLCGNNTWIPPRESSSPGNNW